MQQRRRSSSRMAHFLVRMIWISGLITIMMMSFSVSLPISAQQRPPQSNNTTGKPEQQKSNSGSQVTGNSRSIIPGTLDANDKVFIDPEACRINKSITIADIVAPASFLPIIPASCGSTNDKPNALTLSVAGDIALRFFGALASIAFNLCGFIVIFSGLQWIWGGIDGGKSIAQAKQNFRDAAFGLVLIFSIYTLINTVLLLFRIQLEATTLDQFFTF